MYRVVYFGIGLVVIFLYLFYFTSIQTIKITYDDEIIQINEKGYNISRKINVDEIDRVEYIKTDEILFISTEINGPASKKSHKPRNQILKNYMATKYGVDTKEFAAGE